MSDEREAPAAQETVEEQAHQIEPQTVFVYSWDRYVPRQNGEWVIRGAMKEKAARAYLKERLVEAAQRALPEGSPYRSAVENDDLLSNPLVAQVDAPDREPSKGPLYSAEGRRYFNLYVPPALQSAQGEWPNLEQLIRYLTADADGKQDPKAALWLLTWCAAKLQHPGSTMLTCPVLSGPPGSGKTSLAFSLVEMLGRRNCATIGDNTLGGEFNGSYAGALFVFADDVIPRGSMRNLSGKLKTAITGATVEVNEKFVPRHEMPNRAAWFFCANDRYPIVVEPDDRRYSVFCNRVEVTPEHRAFLRTFWHPEIQNRPSEMFRREMAAFKWELENTTIDFDLIALPYKNTAREGVIEQSLGAEGAFKAECWERGFEEVVADLKWHPLDNPRPVATQTGWYKGSEVFRVFMAWAKSRGRPVLSDTVVGGHLKDRPNPWPSKRSNGILYAVPTPHPRDETRAEGEKQTTGGVK